MRQERPTAPVPAFLRDRAAEERALPQVEVGAGQQQQQQQPGTASGKRKASSEADRTNEEERLHAVLAYVVMQLNRELFTELMPCFQVQAIDEMEVSDECSAYQYFEGGDDGEADPSGTEDEEFRNGLSADSEDEDSWMEDLQEEDSQEEDESRFYMEPGFWVDDWMLTRNDEDEDTGEDMG
jgi:hypothetical protein